MRRPPGGWGQGASPICHGRLGSTLPAGHGPEDYPYICILGQELELKEEGDSVGLRWSAAGSPRLLLLGSGYSQHTAELKAFWPKVLPRGDRSTMCVFFSTLKGMLASGGGSPPGHCVAPPGMGVRMAGDWGPGGELFASVSSSAVLAGLVLDQILSCDSGAGVFSQRTSSGAQVPPGLILYLTGDNVCLNFFSLNN